MPDSLKVHSGERVDLVDYVEGASTYTQEAQKFELERAWLDRRSRILDGFRVQVEDQTANPGMVTIYNGNAVDRDGQLTNNEQLTNDARSITLLGANLNFYVEIEFIQNESSTDARFFWDPTITNTSPIPDGGEFTLNVATRLSPDWRIVSPVSTTGFEQTSNANSIRIPVGVFRTDGSNQISTGGTNPGLTLVTAASVMETDSAIGASQIRVVDCRMFPATTPFNVTVDLGGTAPEARTVSGIDRDNGLLTLSVALASTHLAGSIVRVTSGTAMLVKERTDPSDPALSSALSPPGHPDPAQRFWQADETRGSALTTSKETYGARDDLGIRSLKDQIDALSAQIRELKFGHRRPDVVSAAPPLTFSTRPRWYEAAGSVTGGRTNSVSIGNGTTSFGDFNTTGYADASAMLTAAVAALPASGGTIFVKAGTYSLPTLVTIAKSVTFIGENYATTIFSSTNAAGAAIAAGSTLRFVNMSYQRGGGAAANTLDITAATNVQFDYCVFTGQIRLVAVNAGVIGTSSSFVASSGAPSIIIGSTTGSTLTSARFDRCLISTTGFFIASSVNDVILSGCYGTALAIYLLVDGSVTNLTIRDCKMAITSAVAIPATMTGAVSGVSVYHNRFTIPAMTPASYVLGFWNTTLDTDNVHVHHNYFNFTGGTTSSGSPGIVLWLKSTQTASGVRFENNHIDCNSGSFIVGAMLDQGTLVRSSFSGNYCNRNCEMVRIGGPTGGMSSADVVVKDNILDNQLEHNNSYGVRILSDGAVTKLVISDNAFLNLGAASAVGERVALDLGTTAAGVTSGKWDITGNTCFQISAGDLESHFLRFAPAAPASSYIINIEGNFASTITSPAVASGVYIAPSGTNKQMVKIHGNTFSAIGDSGTGTSAGFGIFAQNINSPSALAPGVVVSENTVYNVYGVDIATGIEIQNCGPSHVRGNMVTDIECADGLSTTDGCCIRYNNATTSTKGLQIVDNWCDQAVNSTPGSARRGIVVSLATGITLTNMQVSRNQCTSSTTPVMAVIDVKSEGATPTGGFVTGAVCDNVINWNSTASSSTCLNVTMGSGSVGMKVDRNVIRETTYHANMVSHVGISVSGGPTAGPRAVSVCDNLLTAPKAGAYLAGPNPNRIGIRLWGSIAATITSNNIVDWNCAGVVVGIGIQYIDNLSGGAGPWRQHVCNGNLISGDDDAGSGGEIDIDTAGFSHGYVIGNNIGTPGQAGTIAPAAPIAGWDYGAGVLTTFQTYNGLNKLT